MKPLPSRHSHARGFAAASALFTIGLFVLIGAVAATTARSNAKAQQFHEIRNQLVAQSELIGSTLVLCRTLYPGADNGSGFHPPYPATPGDGTVKSLICPGSLASIWSGDSRTLTPRTMPGFQEWSYVNDATSVRISTTAVNAGMPYYQDLLDSVVGKVGPGQAVRAGDTLTITLVN